MKCSNANTHLGLVCGAGLSGGASAAVRAFTTLDKWATLIGLAASAVVGGLLAAAGRKDLGLFVVEGGLLAAGPRAIEDLVVGGGLLGNYRARPMLGPADNVEVLGLTTANEETFGNTTGSFGAVPVAGIQ